MAFAISAIAVIMLFSALRRYIAFAMVSPVYVLVLLYAALFPLAALLYDPEYGGTGVSVTSTTSELLDTSAQVYWVLCAFMLGAIVSAALAKRRELLQVSLYQSKGIVLSNGQSSSLIIFGFAAVFLTVLIVGPDKLWRRTEYLATHYSVGYFVAAAFSVAVAFILGIAAAQQQKWCRVSAWILQGINLLLMAALSTRRFALDPILFFVGATVAAPGKRAFRYALIASVVATPLVMEVPMVSRSMPEQGIATLVHVPAVIGELDWRHEWRTVMNCVLISGPITEISAEPLHDKIYSYLLTSVNPLPGSMTDWVNTQNRINLATPYNAIGDLLRGGLWIALIYYFLLGAYFCRIELRLKSQPRVSSGLLLVISLSFFFTVMSLQYPLRIVTRVLYYMMLLDLVSRLLGALKDKAKTITLDQVIRPTGQASSQGT